MAETFQLPGLSTHQDETQRHFKCHSGILKACRALLEPDSEFVRDLASTLNLHPGYQLVLTGHSLGAGVAFVMTMLLASVRPSAMKSEQSASEPTWILRHPSLPDEKGDRLLKAVCFAAPNWCDPALSALVARGAPAPLVTSIVLQGDVVPRFAWPQIRLFKRSLVLLSDLSSAERGPLIKNWLKMQLRLLDRFAFERHAWQLRQKLIGLAQETEPERCGPPGVVFQIERCPDARGQQKWLLHRVLDVQRFYGAVCMS